MGRVFVAGSINMDVVATADRHPRIGETVAGTALLYFPGGKGANQAVAAAKLGAPTTLIGRLGKDAFGDQLKAFLDAQGVDLSFVQATAGAPTGTAVITTANADNTIGTDNVRFMARRATSNVVEVSSSHVAMISNPDAVVKLIRTAARATR